MTIIVDFMKGILKTIGCFLLGSFAVCVVMGILMHVFTTMIF